MHISLDYKIYDLLWILLTRGNLSAKQFNKKTASEYTRFVINKKRTRFCLIGSDCFYISKVSSFPKQFLQKLDLFLKQKIGFWNSQKGKIMFRVIFPTNIKQQEFCLKLLWFLVYRMESEHVKFLFVLMSTSTLDGNNLLLTLAY